MKAAGTGSLLHPPNSHLLSDNVIGAVVTRHARERIRLTALPSKPDTTFSNDQGTQISDSVSGQVDDNSWNSLNTAEKVLHLSRLRRRRTQQRYRKRLEDKTLTLAKDVSRLGAEVQRLEKSLRAPPCVAIDSTPWRLVVEFFRVFRNGLDAPHDVQDTTAPLCLPEDHDQKRFLRATMTPNIAFNNGYGVDAVLENWRFRSAHHEKIEVRLVRLEQGAENLLTAYLSNLTTVTETMLRRSLSCGDGTLPAFAWKLLGRQLEVRTCVHFHWSKEENRFVSALYEADMLTPLLDLLGNLEDASIVLDSTLGIY